MIRVTVRELLRGRKLSIKELAHVAGVRYQTIYNFVNGKTQGVDWNTLDAVCKALQVQPGEVLERHEANARLKDNR